MVTLIKILCGVVAALAVLLLAKYDPALAQDAAAAAAPAAEPAKPAIDSGDTAWMLTSTALVLLMTIPGLALFYAGMVRKKNVLATAMQCFAMTCIVTVVWMVLAYSLAFTDGGAMQNYIGGMSQFLLKGMTLDSTNALAGTIPESVFMTLPDDIRHHHAGAHRRRLRGPHEVLGAGACSWCCGRSSSMRRSPIGCGAAASSAAPACSTSPAAPWCTSMPVSRASSAPSSSASASATARKTWPRTTWSYSVIGASLLWVGWFGFNAGSAVAADGRAGMAMAVTQIATATAALAWMFAEWLVHKKPSVLGIISGAVAGLVAITPASGFVGPVGALWIGAAAGVGCFFAATTFKRALGYDDSLDAFGVHGVGGIIGRILTGVFALEAIGGVKGALEGNAGQILTQIEGIAATLIWSGFATLVILIVVNMLVGVRVTQAVEVEGLDINLHGEVVQ